MQRKRGSVIELPWKGTIKFHSTMISYSLIISQIWGEKDRMALKKSKRESLSPMISFIREIIIMVVYLWGDVHNGFSILVAIGYRISLSQISNTTNNTRVSTQIPLSKVVLCDTNHDIPLSLLWLLVHNFACIFKHKN